MHFRLATAIALCAPFLASQAFASAENEYTLSESDTTTTITTYQPQTFNAQAAMPSYSQQTVESTNEQFGELVFDSQPFFPDANTTGTSGYATSGTETYATQPYTETVQPYTETIQPYTETIQPYTGTTETVTYQPTYQTQMEPETDASWK